MSLLRFFYESTQLSLPLFWIFLELTELVCLSSKLYALAASFQILGNQIEPLTEQQLVGICNLQQSSQQAEDALSQGMEALQQSLVETLSSNSLGPRNTGDVANYMGQMAVAMSKLATLENFLHQVTPIIIFLQLNLPK